MEAWHGGETEASDMEAGHSDEAWRRLIWMEARYSDKRTLVYTSLAEVRIRRPRRMGLSGEGIRMWRVGSEAAGTKEEVTVRMKRKTRAGGQEVISRQEEVRKVCACVCFSERSLHRERET